MTRSNEYFRPALAGDNDREAIGEDFGLVMAQFLEIKAVNECHILFFRAGSGYLLFFEDAEVAARRGGAALKFGKYREDDFAICGVSVESADDCLHKLVGAGLSVAICEQVESSEEARKRGAPFVFRRDVVRCISPIRVEAT
jgi:DNA mismatch repair protein MutS